MVNLSDANVSKAGKLVLTAGVLGGSLLYVLGQWGVGDIGVNLGTLESLVPLGLGAFLVAESVVEDKKKLTKNPIVAVEAIVGLGLVASGLGVAMGNAALTGVVAPYLKYLLTAGVVFGALEATTKI